MESRCLQSESSKTEDDTIATYRPQAAVGTKVSIGSPGMVDVLGPGPVPGDAVVSEPTAGARMKSISPSSQERGRKGGVTWTDRAGPLTWRSWHLRAFTWIHGWRVWHPAGRGDGRGHGILVVAGGGA